VGQTSRDPDLRFDQHKGGHKASRPATRFGVRLLPELVEHLNPMKAWESLDLEAALAEDRRKVGVPWVEGGTDALMRDGPRADSSMSALGGKRKFTVIPLSASRTTDTAQG
jgi:hypothetical protein